MKKYTADDAQQILKKERDFKTQPPQMPDIRVVRNSFYGFKKEPSDIQRDSPEGIVFYNLAVCYTNAGNISEGPIGNVIWGFKQSGIPGYVTRDGLIALKKLNYLCYTDERLLMIFTHNPHEKLWYHWSQKFYDLLLDAPVPKEECVIETPKPVKMEDIK